LSCGGLSNLAFHYDENKSVRVSFGESDQIKDCSLPTESLQAIAGEYESVEQSYERVYNHKLQRRKQLEEPLKKKEGVKIEL